ncbi:MAG: thioredoxin-disulfide reductase [Ruminococcaceae bacterium]|nr:thioredoxin-disulfide reductase [Oscillospiraceae bacterium]
MIYDVLILGGGPAGYTAAMYAARSGLQTAVLEKLSVGGQMVTTDKIDNFPGLPDGIDGYSLGQAMKKGADIAGAKTIFTEILSVSLLGEVKKITTDSGDFFAKSVIVATGADHKHLGIAQEEALVGRGVHYCATCDGMFYRNKTVVVIGGGNSAVGAARYLSRLCKKVIVVHRRDRLRASKAEQEKLQQTENVEFCWNSEVTAFLHEARVHGVTLRNVVTGQTQEVDCDGVFVSVGQSPNTALFTRELALDEGGYILADESTCTSVAGVFAAGDVRTKLLRQVVTACADGGVAAAQAEAFLAEKSS